MRNIGDEVKIRAQRGEKPAVVSLPEGISEEDDSEDFVLGLLNSLRKNRQMFPRRIILLRRRPERKMLLLTVMEFLTLTLF